MVRVILAAICRLRTPPLCARMRSQPHARNQLKRSVSIAGKRRRKARKMRGCEKSKAFVRAFGIYLCFEIRLKGCTATKPCAALRFFRNWAFQAAPPLIRMAVSIAARTSLFMDLRLFFASALIASRQQSGRRRVNLSSGSVCSIFISLCQRDAMRRHFGFSCRLVSAAGALCAPVPVPACGAALRWRGRRW